MKVSIHTDELFPHYIVLYGPRRWTSEFDVPADIIERYEAALTEFDAAREALETAMWPKGEQE
jgi:hypothetical protein